MRKSIKYTGGSQCFINIAEDKRLMERNILLKVLSMGKILNKVSKNFKIFMLYAWE